MKQKGKETYPRDQVIVMLEDMQDQFSAFGDGLKFLDEKVNNLDEKVNNLNDKVDNMKIEMDERFDKLEVKVDGIASDVFDIKEKLSQKVDLEDFQKLEKKVFKLEKLVLSKL